jgi:XTP/dITP diphosphohydrolase
MVERTVSQALSSRPRLVLASGNVGKLREISSMVQPLGWTVLPQSDWNLPAAVEDGATFIENALIKARHAARYTDLPALADDSGLVVDALAGMPGIFSSRFAGEHANDEANNRKLLEMMRDVPLAGRTAYFYCAMVVLLHEQDPAPLLATGRWRGRIAESLSGAGGFGYDPLFWVESHGCTSAELEPGIKNLLSHRGQAMASLLAQLQSVQCD